MESSAADHRTILQRYHTLLEGVDPLRPMGRIVQVSGMSLIAEGPPEVRIGDLCRVETGERGRYLGCEVVGFQEHRLVLMPIGSTTGISPNANVLATGRRLSIPVGMELLGRVLDGIGRPLDDRNPILTGNSRFADADPPSPNQRELIREPLETGVRAIDSLLTVGRGQRVGLFAGTGVGKSTLLGMIARNTRADANVICLVGERGREVREFLENDLGQEGLSRSVVICATSDRSSIEKVYAAGFATSIAEYLRDQGMHVNLMMDSITRYCMAQREIGISTGEQLGPGGYPPSVWLRVSRMLERAGAISGGSITGIYTVLVEGDDMNDPVADNVRGFIDGHIVLSRRLAQRRHYPAIEITESVSRVMDRVINEEHADAAGRLKMVLAAYRENEDLVNLGAYARGSNREVDEAIEKRDAIRNFLCQRVGDQSSFEQSKRQLLQLIKRDDEEAYD